MVALPFGRTPCCDRQGICQSLSTCCRPSHVHCSVHLYSTPSLRGHRQFVAEPGVCHVRPDSRPPRWRGSLRAPPELSLGGRLCSPPTPSDPPGTGCRRIVGPSQSVPPPPGFRYREHAAPSHGGGEVEGPGCQSFACDFSRFVTNLIRPCHQSSCRTQVPDDRPFRRGTFPESAEAVDIRAVWRVVSESLCADLDALDRMVLQRTPPNRSLVTL